MQRAHVPNRITSKIRGAISQNRAGGSNNVDINEETINFLMTEIEKCWNDHEVPHHHRYILSIT